MTMRPLSSRRQAAGFTLIESMIALVILLIAVLAMFSMQVISAKTNRFGDRMVQASSLATDLEENAKTWSYTDSRLTALSSVTSTTDTAITSKWDMGRADPVASGVQAEYSDKASDPNATNSAALGTAYTGLSSDVDGDGTPDFVRYWNVWNIDFSNSGTPDGKLVQIIVRWKEPGLGYRQITSSTFRRNPAKVF